MSSPPSTNGPIETETPLLPFGSPIPIELHQHAHSPRLCDDVMTVDALVLSIPSVTTSSAFLS